MVSPPRSLPPALLCLVLGLLALSGQVIWSPPASARIETPADVAPVAGAGSLAEVRHAPAGPAAPVRGEWPLRPRPEVVERFDPPVVTWGAGHRGVDLAGHAGQPVRAALAGRVSFTGRVAGRPVVVVDHGRTRTTYQPVIATRQRGERVDAGRVVGRLVATGSHCPPRTCLHWGLRRGETYLDPLSLVAAPQPVRLLPW